jgi:hypothetical protein
MFHERVPDEGAHPLSVRGDALGSCATVVALSARHAPANELTFRLPVHGTPQTC